MCGKAQRDGRPAVKWMETFTREQCLRIRVLCFFQISKNLTFYVFLKCRIKKS